MNILEISRVTKAFGSHKVLDGLSLQVPEHCIFGFLGQNGAGKTTTMKIILGLLTMDQGHITVCGEPVSFGNSRTNRFIGYLPDVPEFYGYMKPTEYLRLCGQITGMPKEMIKKRSEELLELTGLTEAKKRKIGGFSRGMKQRLGVAQALLHEPRLLICDEPTSALDPAGRMELLNILSSLKGKTTVLFSTHILSDAERICDRVAVLHKGTAVLNGTLEELKGRKRHDTISVRFSNRKDAETLAGQVTQEYAALLSGPVEAEGLMLLFRTKDVSEMGTILMRLLVQLDIQVEAYELQEPNLENLFMEVIR